MNEVIFTQLPISQLQSLIRISVLEAMNSKPETKVSDELCDRIKLKELTGIKSDATIIKLENLKKLNPIRLGKKVMYREPEVQDFIKNLQRY